MDTNKHELKKESLILMPIQLDFMVDLSTSAPPLPKILTLREFVAQIEREYGGGEHLKALRAAMEKVE